MDIESVPIFRLIGSIDPEAIEVASGDTANPHVPDVTCSMSCRIQIDHPVAVAHRPRVPAWADDEGPPDARGAEVLLPDVAPLVLVRGPLPDHQRIDGQAGRARAIDERQPSVVKGEAAFLRGRLETLRAFFAALDAGIGAFNSGKPFAAETRRNVVRLVSSRPPQLRDRWT